MGSGSNGPYGKSQPYAPTYHVERSMHKQDIARGVFHDGHYDPNPTAMNLNDMIKGNYLGDKRTNIDMPYVITRNGDIIVGRRNGNGKTGLATPHPTLIGGRNPEVAMAGMLHINGGKIASYDAHSGHFKPNKKSLPVANTSFVKLPKILFKKKRGQ
jgi:hypothetical protein